MLKFAVTSQRPSLKPTFEIGILALQIKSFFLIFYLIEFVFFPTVESFFNWASHRERAQVSTQSLMAGLATGQKMKISNLLFLHVDLEQKFVW